MVRIRPTDTDLIKKLTGYPKSYFTVADLGRVLGLSGGSLYVVLGRLVRTGVLERLGKNIYSTFTKPFDVEKIAGELYFPCYLSFEKALSAYGILSQIPQTLTFATTRPTKKMVIAGIVVEYVHLPKKLFFGYKMEGDRYIAEPEKALVDELYLVSRGKRTLNIEELDLVSVDNGKLYAYAKNYPRYLRPFLVKMKDYLGTTPVTLETRERILYNGVIKHG